jgi:2'-5' RNA ligase
MRQRIFIAINFPEKIKQELSQLQKKWPTLPCRWLKKETFHITLTFIGYVNDKELEKVFATTKKTAFKYRPFSVIFTRVCYGPGRIKPPRLVYAYAKESPEFLSLQKDLEKELALTQINFRSKPQSHITLARIKKWNWRRLEPEERPDVDLNISLEVPVNSIEVMESHLKRTGAEYTSLLSAKLAADKSKVQMPNVKSMSND